MRLRSYTSEGIVLNRKNYGEADRILTIYSKHFGKLKLLAKGVRKPRSRKRGHIEIFSRIKFSVSKGNGLDLITEAQLIDSFDMVRKNLKKMSVAYYLCEVINRVTREEEKNESIFTSFVENLGMLSYSKNLRKLRENFVSETLIYLGFWPYGMKMEDPDKHLEEIIENKMSTVRVGKKVIN